MTPYVRFIGAAAGLLAVAAAAWPQGFSLRPGEYEVTSEMQFPGGPAPTATKDFSCITPDLAGDALKLITKTLGEGSQCKVSNVKNSSARLTFDLVCRVDGSPSLTKVEMTHAADSYQQVATTNVKGGVLTLKASAKWLRATCSKRSQSDE